MIIILIVVKRKNELGIYLQDHNATDENSSVPINVQQNMDFIQALICYNDLSFLRKVSSNSLNFGRMLNTTVMFEK